MAVRRFVRIPILYRYLAAEMMIPVVAWLFGLVVVLDGNFLFILLRLAGGRDLPWDATIQHLLYRIPYAIFMGIPMAYLFGTALCLNRFGRDGELTAMRMGGLTPRRILAPSIIASVFWAVAAFVVSDRIMPQTQHKADSGLRSILMGNITLDTTRDVLVKVPQSDTMLYVRHADLPSNTLRTVVLARAFDPDHREFTVAESAVFVGDMWRLNGGRRYVFDRGGRVIQHGPVQAIDIDLRAIITNYWEDYRSPEEQSTRQLAERIRFLRDSGQPANVEINEFHSKFSIACACIAFALVVGPLTLRYGGGGSFTGLLLATVVLFVYYVILAWGKILGHAGRMDPALGAWIQNIVYLIAGAFLIWRSE